MTPYQSCLVQAYAQVGIPLDRLPYSEAFERIVALVGSLAGNAISPREAWTALLDLRKRGQLPRVGRSAPSPKQTDIAGE